jgi:hypothetical protein
MLLNKNHKAHEVTRDVTAWAFLTSPALADRRCLVDSSRCCWQLLLRLGPPRPNQHKAIPCVPGFAQTVHADFALGIAHSTEWLSGFPTGRRWVSIRTTSLSCRTVQTSRLGEVVPVLPDPFLESPVQALGYPRFLAPAGSDRPHLHESFTRAADSITFGGINPSCH